MLPYVFYVMFIILKEVCQKMLDSGDTNADKNMD